MLNAQVRAREEITNLNKCARSIRANEIGAVVESVEHKKGFQLIVEFDGKIRMQMVHFKVDPFNRNKLEIVNV